MLPNPKYKGFGPFWIHRTKSSCGWYFDPRFKKQ